MGRRWYSLCGILAYRQAAEKQRPWGCGAAHMIPELGKWKQEDWGFTAVLRYTVRSRPVWAASNLVSKKETKKERKET